MRSLMVLICGLCTTKQVLAEQLVSGVYRRCRSLTQQTLYKVQCTAGFESTLRKGKLLWTPCPWYQQYALLENVFVAGQEQTVKLAFQPAARSAVSAELRDVISCVQRPSQYQVKGIAAFCSGPVRYALLFMVHERL